MDSWNQIIPGPLGANGPGAIDLHLLVAGGPVDEKEVPPRVQKKGTTFFFLKSARLGKIWETWDRSYR